MKITTRDLSAASTSSAPGLLRFLDGGFDRLRHRVSGTILVAELVEVARSSEHEHGG